mmetsp:Transcript_23482/g.56685  ORF Transcript_23482/g.56685 Transcript_23482/m.56685 type:complete len:110 (-) Transcript_23482:108-437(-)
MKSSIFKLASLTWMGASVCAHELLRGPSLAVTGDASDAVVKAATHTIQFDIDDESSDEDRCGFRCEMRRASCRTKRRATCWTDCNHEGVLNGGSECRKACRAEIDCDVP